MGKKGRKAEGRVGLVGFKCPCLLVLTTEKVVELRFPLWSQFGKAGEDLHGRGEPALGNSAVVVMFAGEREKNHIWRLWMCFIF